MAKDRFIVIEDFKAGWHRRDDDSRIPLGGARISSNITLTDRGGIAPRPGEILIGDSAVGTGVTSAHSFKKPGQDALRVKATGTELLFFSNKAEAWSLINDGYRDAAPFYFKEARNDKLDTLPALYFGNGYDPFSRWYGFDAEIATNVALSDTSIAVDTTLLPEVHFSGTASASTGTTITIATAAWAADIWNDNFYVRITSGAQTGKIALISDTTATGLVFASIAGLTGAVTFEIRQLAVPPTGTLVYSNGTTYVKKAYTAVPTDASFTVASIASGETATAGAALTTKPIEYLNSPRAKRAEVINDELYLGIVTSSGLQVGTSGNSAPNTVYRSATADFTDFTFSDPRSPDQGDVIRFPYGGSGVTDIARWEDLLLVLTEDSVESCEYVDLATDLTDVARQKSIKVGTNVGTKFKTWQVEDDVMFVTPDNRITTIGRVINKDTRPQTMDRAYSIRREVKNYDFSAVTGADFNNQSFVGMRSTSAVTANDRTIVWNKDYGSWEGRWNTQASVFFVHNGKLNYGDAFSPDVYEFDGGINKRKDGETYPMTCRWLSGWINGRGSAFYLNEVSSLAVEGRIRLNTQINFKLYKDYASSSFQTLYINASADTEAVDGVQSVSFLGGSSTGTEPLGAGSFLGDEDEDGYRHFVAFLPFPITQIEYVSIEVGSEGTNQGWEITRLGLNLLETMFENQPRILNRN